MLACNMGYARGQCACFPNDPGPDVVRFSIAHVDSSGLRLCFVQERDHHPFAHGTLEYSFALGFAAAPNPLLERQAMAYVESYRRRRRDL